LKTAFRSKAPEGYSPGMRAGGRDKRWLLTVLRRVVRWNAHSYLQILIMTAAGCLVSVSAVLLTQGWPRASAPRFLAAAVIWTGFAVRQSYELRRRRNEEPR
jgi:hypothetical protein